MQKIINTLTWNIMLKHLELTVQYVLVDFNCNRAGGRNCE